MVLDNESEEYFGMLLQQHIDKFDPADDIEFSAIEEMVSSVWRMRRLWSIEKHLFDKDRRRCRRNLEVPYHRPRSRRIGPHRCRVLHFGWNPELQLLELYESRLVRAHHRALRNLLLLRELDNPRSPEPQAESDAEPESAPVPPQSAEPAPVDPLAPEASALPAAPANPPQTETAKRTQQPATLSICADYERLSWEERLTWTRGAQRNGPNQQQPVPQTT